MRAEGLLSVYDRALGGKRKRPWRKLGPLSVLGAACEDVRMEELCMWGGFCARRPGHLGCHTARPMPTTDGWDGMHASSVEDAASLLMLDFPSPPWADLLDDDE